MNFTVVKNTLLLKQKMTATCRSRTLDWKTCSITEMYRELSRENGYTVRLKREPTVSNNVWDVIGENLETGPSS